MAEPISAQVDAAAANPPASTPPASTAPATPAPSQTPPSANPATPSSDPAAGSTAPAAPVVPGWLNTLREKGMDFGNDEAAAFERLSELHRNYTQVAPLAPYVQQYVQYAPQFSKFLAEQQRQQQQKPADANAPFYASYFNPPEFNPAWERMITQDANGNLIPVQGAPPDIIPKYLAHQQFKKEQAEKFLQNPHEYMKETITHLAREEAKKIVQEQFGQVQTQNSVQDFMAQNQNWLYEMDPSGRPAMTTQFNPATGQYEQKQKLSQWGKAFAEYVKQESEWQEKAGIPQDIVRQRDVALAAVQRDYAIWKMNNGGAAPAAPAAAPAVSPQQAVNQRFLQQNNPPAGMPGAGGPSNPAPPGPINSRNLLDALRQNFKAKGITDEVLQNQT